MSARPRVRGKLSTFVGCPCTMPPAVCCTVSTKGCRTMHVAGANKPLSQASRKARKLCINGKERAPLCGGTQLRRNLREIAAIYDDNMTSVHHGGSCKLARVRGCAQKNRICQVATDAFRRQPIHACHRLPQSAADSVRLERWYGAHRDKQSRFWYCVASRAAACLREWRWARE